jgi:hypothetical protein
MNLERAKTEAAKLLINIPVGAELDITKCEHDIWLGMGYFVGKGWTVYRGSNCYRMTEDGRKRIAQHV